MHQQYMQRCFQLARLGCGYVAPNPMVGAVLVHEGEIIGEGYHQQYGGPHAEVHCIEDALKQHKDKIISSTLYVSLEPCAHYGKTPPCADLIIKHQIPRVVIGCSDIFQEVNGKGVQKLQAAGVSVTVGVLEQQAIELNKAFLTYHTHKRPYIILKWAQTADGFIDSVGEERLLISNEYTNRLVHQWRSETVAIMVGAHTAIKDNPILNNRLWMGKSPKKILWDPHLRVPKDLRLFAQQDETLVFNRQKEAVEGNIHYLQVNDNEMIRDVLQRLYDWQIQSVLIEGGRQLLQLFIDAGLWDEARVIVNKNAIIRSGVAAPVLSCQQPLKTVYLANDEISYYKNSNNLFVHGVA